jgi:hypothetical protein
MKTHPQGALVKATLLPANPRIGPVPLGRARDEPSTDYGTGLQDRVRTGSSAVRRGAEAGGTLRRLPLIYQEADGSSPVTLLQRTRPAGLSVVREVKGESSVASENYLVDLKRSPRSVCSVLGRARSRPATGPAAMSNGSSLKSPKRSTGGSHGYDSTFSLGQRPTGGAYLLRPGRRPCRHKRVGAVPHTAPSRRRSSHVARLSQPPVALPLTQRVPASRGLQPGEFPLTPKFAGGKLAAPGPAAFSGQSFQPGCTPRARR